jgi:hypothetical protein
VIGIKEAKQSKYGRPPAPMELPKPRKRLPQYDECLNDFLASADGIWAITMDSLPSKNPRTILSSLKWRIKNKPEFKGIRAFMNRSKIYLEKEKHESNPS